MTTSEQAHEMSPKDHGPLAAVSMRVAEEQAKKKVSEGQYKWEFRWNNIVILSLLHLGAIYGATMRSQLSFKTEIFIKVHTLFLGLGTTAGYHRLFSHRTYKANAACQILLMMMGSCCYQNSIYVWCRDHRLHHKYSETDADPHNAKRGFFFSHMGWLLVRKHPEARKRCREIDMSDLTSNPVVMFQHRYYFIIVTIFTFFIPTFVPWYFFDEPLQRAFFTATLQKLAITLNLIMFTNSLAHLWGTKPYNRNIGPTENLIVRITNYGEGFHNYHHTFPQDYKAGEFGGGGQNITAYFIEFLRYIGWARDLKTVPKELVNDWAVKYGDGNREGPDQSSWMDKYLSKNSKYRVTRCLEWIGLLFFMYYI